MDVSETRRIVNADRMNDGLIIRFNDGRCAFYSCEVLYATLAKCEELNDKEVFW